MGIKQPKMAGTTATLLFCRLLLSGINVQASPLPQAPAPAAAATSDDATDTALSNSKTAAVADDAAANSTEASATSEVAASSTVTCAAGSGTDCASTASSAASSKKLVIYAGIGCAVVALLIGGWFGWKWWKKKKALKDAPPAEDLDKNSRQAAKRELEYDSEADRDEEGEDYAKPQYERSRSRKDSDRDRRGPSRSAGSRAARFDEQEDEHVATPERYAEDNMAGMGASGRKASRDGQAARKGSRDDVRRPSRSASGDDGRKGSRSSSDDGDSRSQSGIKKPKRDDYI